MLGCVSFGLIEHLFIWLVIICAVLAVIRVLLNLATIPPEFGWIVNALSQIIGIVLWAAVVIAVIVLVFGLLSCIVAIR